MPPKETAVSIHDHHNDPKDPINQPPRRSGPANASMGRDATRDRGIGAWIIGLLALVAVIGAVIYSMSDRKTTASNPVPAPTSSMPSSTPSTTTGSGAGSNSGARAPDGHLETKSGGAPASSPQGETPPGMQSAPAGSSKPVEPKQQ